MKVNILGVPYELLYLEKTADAFLEEADGYCDNSTKRIVVRSYTKEEREEPMTLGDLDAYMRKCARHEITHAFLYESGLSVNAAAVDAWPRNEEMVDWIAIQGPKLYNAWKEAGVL